MKEFNSLCCDLWWCFLIIFGFIEGFFFGLFDIRKALMVLFVLFSEVLRPYLNDIEVSSGRSLIITEWGLFNQ